MAKIENYTLHTLQKLEQSIKNNIQAFNISLEQVKSDYDRLTNDIHTQELNLRNVQDSIALLERQSLAMKKKAKKDDSKD